MEYSLSNSLVGGSGSLNLDKLSLDLQFATDKTLTARRGPTPVFTRASGDNLGVTYIAPLYINASYSLAGVPSLVTVVQTTSLNNGRFIWTEADTSLSYNGTAWVLSDLEITVATSAPTTAYRPDLANWSGTGATVSASNIFGNVKAANNEPRFDYNPTTGVCKGLLIEESRTNLVFPSAALTTQTCTVTAVAHTLSFYGTGTVVLSGAHGATVTGTGGFPTRTTLTFTPTAGSLILTVTGSVTEAQLEAGAFATSYIPTTTATLQRTPDICSITGSAFSGIYNAIEGTFLSSSSQPFITAGIAQVYAADDGSDSNRFNLRHPTSFAVAQASGATRAQFDMTNPTANQLAKFAFAYKTNDYGFYFNGTQGTTTLNNSPPTVDRVFLGSKGHSSTEYLNGHIQSFRFFKKRLPNAKLQTLTT